MISTVNDSASLDNKDDGDHHAALILQVLGGSRFKRILICF